MELAALDGARFAREKIHNGHRRGMAICLICGDSVAIWSTPRVPEHTAEAIQRFASRHDHKKEPDDHL